jgi:hypothetical protein
MAIPAKTIDEVLTELDRIIDQTVAAQIKLAIREKQFEDNDRMELLDVTFANFYLTAYQSYENNESCSASWQTAFDAKNGKITILQHLLLGMNAHINLDLGIAAATFHQGFHLPGLENDFMKVNQILANLTNEMQDRVSKVSRLMVLLDWIGKNTDELMINFSMVKAREQSWKFACRLAEKNENERKSEINHTDQTIAEFAAVVKNPPGNLLKMALKLVALFEVKNMKTIISKLKED